MNKILKILIIVGLIVISILGYAIVKIEKNIDQNPAVIDTEQGGDIVTKPAIDQEEPFDERANDERVTKVEINIPIEGTEKYYEDVVLQKPPFSILVLVNKSSVLPHDYEPEDLVTLDNFAPGRMEEVKQMRKVAAEAMVELVAGAETDGYEILPTSGYRSYQLQTTIFQNVTNSYGSVESANTVSALPGQSEHQSGLAMDMSCESVNYRIVDAFGETEEAKWLAEHAYEYGFIIRYPKGKEDITGYQYEPWHLRYVGEDAAKEIYEQDITFEEYSAELV